MNNIKKTNRGFISSRLNATVYGAGNKMFYLGIRMFIVLVTVAFHHRVHAQTTFEQKLIAYRDSINRVFADPEKSILSQEDIAHFDSLAYFPPNSSYRVEARFRRIKNANVVKMKTSGSRTPAYKPYGKLKFKLNGNKCELTLYQNAEPNRPELKNYLLLAFTDQTSGFETYGGGRYLDFNTAEIGKKVTIDFNYCYNPYCAYTDKYSCVIPPAENNLPIKIEAGVKKFHE